MGVYCANQATISIAKDLVHHDGIKHVDIDWHLIKRWLKTRASLLTTYLPSADCRHTYQSFIQEHFWRIKDQGGFNQHIQSNLGGALRIGKLILLYSLVFLLFCNFLFLYLFLFLSPHCYRLYIALFGCHLLFECL